MYHHTHVARKAFSELNIGKPKFPKFPDKRSYFTQSKIQFVFTATSSAKNTLFSRNPELET